jgi:hypothetical protein
MRTHTVLNYALILQVIGGAPPVIVAAISSITERGRPQHVEDLTHLYSEYIPDMERWRVLGRAAEFMVSQRGLPA